LSTAGRSNAKRRKAVQHSHCAALHCRLAAQFRRIDKGSHSVRDRSSIIRRRTTAATMFNRTTGVSSSWGKQRYWQIRLDVGKRRQFGRPCADWSAMTLRFERRSLSDYFRGHWPLVMDPPNCTRIVLDHTCAPSQRSAAQRSAVYIDQRTRNPRDPVEPAPAALCTQESTWRLGGSRPGRAHQAPSIIIGSMAWPVRSPGGPVRPA
jgi:hypothetical protein